MWPKYKKVSIQDYSRYQSDKSSNGGAYGFTETYRPVPDGRYEVRFYTTADFEYCEFCGNWGDCGCSKEPQIFSETDVETKIRDANNDPSAEIYAEMELFNQEDAKILRRRVEDALRKNQDVGMLFMFASWLNVKF